MDYLTKTKFEHFQAHEDLMYTHKDISSIKVNFSKSHDVIILNKPQVEIQVAIEERKS